MRTRGTIDIGDPLRFSGVRDDLRVEEIASAPFFVYLRGPATGLDPGLLARDCYRLGRVMVSWSVESREAGGAHAVGIARLNLARRFRQAGRAWRLRAQGVGA